MKNNNEIEIKDKKWKIIANIDSKEVILTLYDNNNKEVVKKINNSEFTTNNAHAIGTNLEQEYNKKNNVIIEPQDISMIIGLVDNIIKKEKD